MNNPPVVNSTKTMKVRFGPFEADPAAGELRKQGVPIRLQEQPFRVLQALLERPGEVVSREDLITRLWADGSHVDYDRGLNAAVTRLRQALSDSSEIPRYIETVPKRGYRFVGTLAAEAAPEPQPAAASPVRPRRRWIWVVAAAVVLSAAVVAVQVRWPAGTTETQPDVPVPLTSYPGYESRGSLSPDGKQVAFDWTREPGDTRVYIKIVGAGDPVRLTSGGAVEFNPVWSPDGREIAFLRLDGPGRIGVYVTAALAGVERKLAEYPVSWDMNLAAISYSGLLAWTRDGSHLVAVAEGRGRSTGLLLVPIDGGETRWLRPPPDGDGVGDYQPSFSPDGKRIAFVHRSAHMSGDLYVAPFDSGNISGEPRRVTRVNKLIGGLSWLPDGRSLIFSAEHAVLRHLYRVDSDSPGDPVPLYIAGHWALQPFAAHPGGLVFSRQTNDANIWLQEVAPGGRPPTKLIASTEIDRQPQYSPDGARIAFLSTRSGAHEIWTCASDGSRCAQVTRHSDGRAVGSPRWSPDGRLIAFDAAIAGTFDIHVVNAEGGNARRLTSHPSNDAVPSFSHDGRHIYFWSERSGEAQVWRVPADGGEQVQITTGGGFIASEDPDGKSLYYSRCAGPQRPCGIWRKELRMQANDVRIVERAYLRWWGLSAGRLWYVTPSGGDAELRYVDLKTGRDVRLGAVPVPGPNSGASMSSDGRYIVYAQDDNHGGDLMLLKNFR
jgi:Tol biopolymer transport system component/DNA-binding winged helix-turn-helix (wHTH) protein